VDPEPYLTSMSRGIVIHYNILAQAS
jgi:hypothetical protein